MKPREYDWAADSYGCWALARAVQRERAVRSGQYAPRSDREARQAAEGPVAVAAYDAVREAADG